MASQEIIKMKAAQVEEIKSKIESAKSVILINYSGLTVAQDTDLRRAMRQAGVDYTVYKNRLAKRAFNELGYTDFDEALNGPTAIALSTTDPAAPAKVLSDKIKEFWLFTGMVRKMTRISSLFRLRAAPKSFTAKRRKYPKQERFLYQGNLRSS